MQFPLVKENYKRIHLSDVLNKYDGEANVLEEIIESFTRLQIKES